MKTLPTGPPVSHEAYIKALLSISSHIYQALTRLPDQGAGTATEQDYRATLRALTRAYRHRARTYDRTHGPDQTRITRWYMNPKTGDLYPLPTHSTRTAGSHDEAAPASNEQAGAAGVQVHARETLASYHAPAPGKAGH